MPLKIAIAHPIYNNRFNIMSRWAGTIDGNLTAGVSTAFTDSVQTGRGEANKEMGLGQGSEASVPEIDFAGDLAYAILGPSSNSGYLGLTEYKPVQIASYATSVNTYTLPSVVSNSYQAGDQYSLLSFGLPDGWVGGSPVISSNQFSCGRSIGTNLFPQKNGLLSTGSPGGMTDPYCWQMLNMTGADSNITSLKIGRLIPGETYVMEVVYRGIGYSGGSSELSVYENIGFYNVNMGSSITFGTTAGWTVGWSQFTAGDTQADDAFILINTPTGVSATALLIRNISLSQQVYDWGVTGVPTLTDLYPDQESITVTRRTIGQKSMSTFANKLRPATPHQSMGVKLPATHYTIDMSFSNAKVTELQRLEKLIQFQNLGFLVNFFPGLVGLPYCLTGVVGIQVAERFVMHNHNVVNFNFTFTEVDI